MPFTVESIPVEPCEGQLPGTSGLRKKTSTFTSGYYLHNFVQSIFDALPVEELKGSTLVVSGDGRYYVPEAIQIILQLAAANGVARVWVGKNGLMSTPGVSATIRSREGGAAYGGIILTASHNPGGPEADFGVKYNTQNGGPAPASVTNAIYQCSKEISRIRVASDLPQVDLGTVGTSTFDGPDGRFTVEVVDPTAEYTEMLRGIFDFESLRAFFARPDVDFVYDALNGVAGVYAQTVFVEALGAKPESLRNCTPLPDFGGLHPDPNLTYAEDLVRVMGLTRDGSIRKDVDPASVPVFGAAADGDADRAMVLGKQFFVSPSDSVAVIAANATCIPFFRDGLKGAARSMPTSQALDLVAKRVGFKCFEVPTGWKFFGNLMGSKELFGKEDYTPFICGEESFGCGSNHIREKDGIWTVLCWLSILASRNADASQPLVSVEEIVREHWATYGRNYYARYDYEGVDKEAALRMMARLEGMADLFAAGMGSVELGRGFRLAHCDNFEYTDPVDGSVAAKQGMRFVFEDGSRFVVRLSGTGSVGATIRLYLEKYEAPDGDLAQHPHHALRSLAEVALRVTNIPGFTGREEPSVIT